MSEKTIDLGIISPEFQLVGTKLQIRYPNEDWGELADFGDVATSLELRLNEDTNTVEVTGADGEWKTLLDLSKVGGGIKTVQTWRDLPADAKEGDVCLVLEDGLGEDDWVTPTVEDVGYDRITQLTLGNTVEENLSAMGFDFSLITDNTNAASFRVFVQLLTAENYMYIASFYHAKSTDGSATGIAFYNEEPAEGQKFYLLADSHEVISELAEGIEVDDSELNRWLEVDPYTDEYTVMDSAPVFDIKWIGTESSFANVDDTVVTNCVAEVAYENAVLGAFSANLAPRKRKGLYAYNGEAWSSVEDEATVFIQSEDSDYSDFNSDLEVLGYRNQTITAYSRVCRSMDVSPSDISLSAYLGGEVYNSSADVVCNERWLNTTLSDTVLEALNGRTLVFGSLYIAGADGLVLVCSYYAGGFAVYNSVAGTVFNPETFSDVCRDYAEMPTATLSDTGWYIFREGIPVKATTRFTAAQAVNREKNSTNGGMYLLDGLTATVPDELSTDTTVDLTGLFTYRSSVWEDYTVKTNRYSYVYDVPVRVEVYYDELCSAHFLLTGDKSNIISNAHRHDNKGYLDEVNYNFIQNTKNANEKAHEHENFDYLETLSDTHDYSKAAEFNGSLIIGSTEETSDGLAYYEAEGTSPEIFKKMHTIGTPYPFWNKVGDKIFYDWALDAPSLVNRIGDYYELNFGNIPYNSAFTATCLFEGETQLTGAVTLDIVFGENGADFAAGEASHLFRNCVNLEEAYLSFSFADSVKSPQTEYYLGLFANCTKLRKVVIYSFCNQGTAMDNGKMTDMFLNTFSLEEVTINGYPGTDMLHMHYSDNLTTDSMVGVAKQAEGYSGDFHTTISYGTKNIEKLSEDQIYEIVTAGGAYLV